MDPPSRWFGAADPTRRGRHAASERVTVRKCRAPLTVLSDSRFVPVSLKLGGGGVVRDWYSPRMPYNRNVFILGAGASADAGAPLLRSFLGRARDLVDDASSGLTDQERQRFLKVFAYQFDLLRAHATINVDLDNLEDLFSICDLESLAGDPVAQKLKPDFVFLIVKTLGLLARAPTNADIGRPFTENDPYLWFVRKVARIKVTPTGFGDTVFGTATDSIISFNYDTVIDDAFRRANIAPNYHLKGFSRPTGTWIPAPISLIKLHGSANWLYCDTCKDLQLLVPSGRPPLCNGTEQHPPRAVDRPTDVEQGFGRRDHGAVVVSCKRRAIKGQSYLHYRLLRAADRHILYVPAGLRSCREHESQRDRFGQSRNAEDARSSLRPSVEAESDPDRRAVFVLSESAFRATNQSSDRLNLESPRRYYSTRSFAFAASTVCHCMFDGESAPPCFSAWT
jgi:hypothetical protein